MIKLGGNPRLIQHEDYYFTKLTEDSFSFFFQVDEDGYPDTLLQDDHSYPFGFGSLYIFAKTGTNDSQDPVAGFGSSLDLMNCEVFALGYDCLHENLKAVNRIISKCSI